MMENCILCGEEAILRCDGCATGGTMAYFCSKEHQKMHQGEDGKCFGFSIESSATLGRLFGLILLRLLLISFNSNAYQKTFS